MLKKLFNRKKVRKDTMIEVIENQLVDNDPPGILLVFEKLKSDGYAEDEIKKMFAAVFEGELYKLNGPNQEFDRAFYLETLKTLE
jgi:hypothetical protein